MKTGERRKDDCAHITSKAGNIQVNQSGGGGGNTQLHITAKWHNSSSTHCACEVCLSIINQQHVTMCKQKSL